MRKPYLALLLLASCGDCADGGPAMFFEPETYGEYQFEPQPDLRVERVVDFGEVDAGEVSVRELVVRNVGRVDLLVDRFELNPDAFSVDRDRTGRTLRIAPREQVVLPIEYLSDGGDKVGSLRLYSNDPDEPTANVVLLANRTTACVGQVGIEGPAWQRHDGEGPQCWPEDSPGHGHQVEYNYAEVPAPEDPGWVAEPDNRISFERRSSLCGFECSCGNGGDFTYFQTFVFLPENAALGSYRVDIEDVDDGARVTVYNDRYPDGVTDPNSYARLPGGSTADLARYLHPGSNRVVITHVDDCCSVSRIRNVTITFEDQEVERCAD